VNSRTLDYYWTGSVTDARDLFIIDLFAGGGGASEGIRLALIAANMPRVAAAA